MLLSRMCVEQNNLKTGMDFSAKSSVSADSDTLFKKLRNSTDLKAIYGHLQERKLNIFQDEILVNEIERSVMEDDRSFDLDVASNQSWFKYIILSEQNYNCEHYWYIRLNYGTKSLPSWLYSLESNTWYRLFIYIISICLCCCAFWEKTNWAIYYPTSSIAWQVLGCEAGFIVFIIFDTLLQTYLAFKLKSFELSHFAIQVLFSCCFTADWIGFAAAGVPRWSRLLRPLFFLYRYKVLRLTSIMIFQSYIAARYVILLFFSIVIIACAFAISIFDAIPAVVPDGDFTATSFTNFYSSFVNLYIFISSGKNYADVSYMKE